jgi:hypothetical protein
VNCHTEKTRIPQGGTVRATCSQPPGLVNETREDLQPGLYGYLAVSYIFGWTPWGRSERTALSQGRGWPAAGVFQPVSRRGRVRGRFAERVHLPGSWGEGEHK